MFELFKRFLADQQGVTAIEYGMMGVALAGALALIMGNQDSGFIAALSSLYSSILTAIQSA
ncbi:Flp/Fap pilin component family protein [Vibrio halioticoli NBRC 102217]|uniref:Flp/Fap pilin component family protein n=1 Tax=Vibrio halioticoli NBRC 102217 TaxID=1219072 RepID=V5FH14_9VIBR|nr:Flp family type IVb pilin [Vibrio halioticoli]GAD88332.1 Flp/Fap pilin component family protein [Vibrio halioticoli NBRC 102217]